MDKNKPGPTGRISYSVDAVQTLAKVADSKDENVIATAALAKAVLALQDSLGSIHMQLIDIRHAIQSISPGPFAR